jgi:hypothetical protein
MRAAVCGRLHLRIAAASRFMGRCVLHSEFVAMPRKDIAQAPALLCVTAKELADQIEKYKASCTTSDYRLANGAFMDARRLLVDFRNLLHSLRGIAGRR